MNVKEQLYQLCESYIKQRHKTVENTINDIQNALLSETKSSAGDKHETGRAMLQLEREKAGNQLAEIQKLRETLSKIDVEKSQNTIGLGSVVYTSNLNYFIAISAGELTVDTDKFYAISANTPIGQLLLGKTVKDVVEFRNNRFSILTVL